MFPTKTQKFKTKKKKILKFQTEGKELKKMDQICSKVATKVAANEIMCVEKSLNATCLSALPHLFGVVGTIL